MQSRSDVDSADLVIRRWACASRRFEGRSTSTWLIASSRQPKTKVPGNCVELFGVRNGIDNEGW